MLIILSSIFGFVGPFIPELIKLLRMKMDNAHELAVLEFQLEASKFEHAYKMDEIGAQTAANIMISNQPVHSFGVQLLDATRDWPKVIIVPIFYLFALLDFISGVVRPSVTFIIVGFYLFYKWALFDLAKVDHSTFQLAIQSIWTENDWAVLFLVLSTYFGSRIVKATFGGSTSTGKSGGG